MTSAGALEPDGRIRLTARERDVLELIAGGLRQDEVGARLGITAETVHSHVRNASGRLGAANVTQAVAIAIRRRLIDV